jgi:hypothetical protein
MTEQLPTIGSGGATAAIAATNYRGQPLKTAQHLAEGKRLAEMVAAHRADRGEASAAAVLHKQYTGNKPRSRRLPTAQYPSEIPGYPLNPNAPKEIPDYRTIETAEIVVRARRAKGRSLMEPIGPSELRKRDDVRTWKVAE